LKQKQQERPKRPIMFQTYLDSLKCGMRFQRRARSCASLMRSEFCAGVKKKQSSKQKGISASTAKKKYFFNRMYFAVTLVSCKLHNWLLGYVCINNSVIYYIKLGP
jgi:hypothetical protein